MHSENDSISIWGNLIADRYEVVRSLGQTSICQTFLVKDRAIDSSLTALKLFHPRVIADQAMFAKLQRLVFTAQQLSHTNIVRIYDFERINQEQCMLSMEYVDGCSLRDILDKNRAEGLPFEVALKIIFETARGLTYAHHKHILHNSIKPENILIGKNGEIKLSDFGLTSSIATDIGFTMTGEMANSPEYDAPELLEKGEFSELTDIYSLGITAIEMIYGSCPIKGNTYLEIAESHINSSSINLDDYLAGTPDWFAEVISKAVTKEPSGRLPSSQSFVDQLAKHSQDILNAETSLFLAELLPDEIAISHFGRTFRFVAVALLLIGVPYSLTQRSVQMQISLGLLKLEHYLAMDIEFPKPYLMLDGSLNRPDEIFDLIREQDTHTYIPLIEAGINPNLLDQNRRPLLHHMAIHSYAKLTELLLRRGADPNGIDPKGNSAIFYKNVSADRNHIPTLLRYGADINIQNLEGNSALHWEMYNLNIPRINSLLQAGIKIDLRNRLGQTPLIYGIQNFHSTQLIEKATRLLLNHSADVRARDNIGMTAILYSSKNGLTAVTRLLIDSNADVLDHDLNGKTVLEYAKENGDKELIAIIETSIRSLKQSQVKLDD